MSRTSAVTESTAGWLDWRKRRVQTTRGMRMIWLFQAVTNLSAVNRREFDSLKAMLTNCIRLGPESQNRDGHPDFRAHVLGRVAFLESVNALRGRKLRRMIEQINW